jgi:hypothetical protein
MTIILSRWWCNPFTAFNEKAETYGFNSKYRFDGSPWLIQNILKSIMIEAGLALMMLLK